MSVEQVQDQIERVDGYFKAFNIKNSDITGEQQQRIPIPENNYNSRGQQMLTPKQIRQKYGNALYGFKWYQIPLCRKSIKKKVYFWAPSSIVMAWTYGEWVKKRDPTNIIKTLPFKFYLKSFAIFFLVTTAYSVAESLLSDEFCDIDSPFYQQDESRLSIAKRIKTQIKTTGNGGVISDIFG